MYTAGQAAKAARVSKTTISNALRSGRLSYVEKTKAGYVIDPAELHRVFPIPSTVTDKVDDQEHPRNPDLEQQMAMLREMLADMKDDRDQWRDQAQRLLLTTGQRGKRGGVWDWLKSRVSP